MKKMLPPVAYWQDFEDLIKRLFQSKYPGEIVQKYGRSGQYQAGIDVYVSTIDVGVQCKKKDQLAGSSLGIKEIQVEVKKALQHSPPLKKYFICYTGQKDKKLQDEAKKISDKHKKRGLFEVVVMSWEDINEEIWDQSEVLLYYLNDLIQEVGSIRGAVIKKSATETLEDLKGQISSVSDATFDQYINRLNGQLLSMKLPPDWLGKIVELSEAVKNRTKKEDSQLELIRGSIARTAKSISRTPETIIDELIADLSS